MAQDLTFITKTIQTMTESVHNTETLHKIIGTANQYAMTMKFPLDKTEWSDKQLDKYLSMIEKLIAMPVEYTHEEFESMDLLEKLESVGLKATEIEPGLQESGNMLGDIVNKMEQQNKYRDDLKCPCPNGLMVWDNRKSKKSDKSPDFTCSGKTPMECPMHTGKWKKSWWLDNSDIPKEWNLDGEQTTA
tara:strand:- start:11101 stop:11667 length:567 start_codon:yes stop_codon:yes gene_type:complete